MASSRDIIDIGNILGNIVFKQWLVNISEISTILLLMAYTYEIVSSTSLWKYLKNNCVRDI